jgi:hypothetical protein
MSQQGNTTNTSKSLSRKDLGRARCIPPRLRGLRFPTSHALLNPPWQGKTSLMSKFSDFDISNEESRATAAASDNSVRARADSRLAAARTQAPIVLRDGQNRPMTGFVDAVFLQHSATAPTSTAFYSTHPRSQSSSPVVAPPASTLALSTTVTAIQASAGRTVANLAVKEVFSGISPGLGLTTTAVKEVFSGISPGLGLSTASSTDSLDEPQDGAPSVHQAPTTTGWASALGVDPGGPSLTSTTRAAVASGVAQEHQVSTNS